MRLPPEMISCSVIHYSTLLLHIDIWRMFLMLLYDSSEASAINMQCCDAMSGK